MMRHGLLASAVLSGIGAMGGPALADDTRQLSLGRHLAQECTSCHRVDGVDNGIPSINGRDANQFVATLRSYLDGAAPTR